jgi:hypothetical protein
MPPPVAGGCIILGIGICIVLPNAAGIALELDPRAAPPALAAFFLNAAGMALPPEGSGLFIGVAMMYQLSQTDLCGRCPYNL